MSLIHGSLPDQFLISNITPIIKDENKSKNFFTNWRPISLTSIVARVCERAISVILLDEIERNGGIRDIQFGARKGMGCREALTYALLGINKTIAKDGICHGVFMDVSKAFDRVDPYLLTRKLLDFGINKVLVRWILCFLQNRKLRVKVGGDMSDWFNVDAGIPQGTVLGPILWLLWVNDCPVDNLHILSRETDRGCLFVDDLFLFSSGTEQDQKNDLEKRLDKLYAWSNDWGVDFNPSKTKHMIFRVSTKKKEVDQSTSDIRLSLGGKVLKISDRYKYLGLIFTSDLNFDTHVTEYLLPKVRRISGYVRHLLGKIKTGRCTFLRILWLSKIQPVLEYGSAVWSSFIKKDTMKLINFFQKEFFRKAMGLPSKTCCSGLLCDFSIMQMSLRYERARWKLRTMFDNKLMPVVVQRQLAAYQSVRTTRVVKFRSPSKIEAVKMRSSYIQANPHTIEVPRKECRQKYVQSLTQRFLPTICGNRKTYEYRYLYPNYNKPFGQEWVAKLRIKAMPSFPAMTPSITKAFNFEQVAATVKENRDDSFVLGAFSMTTRDFFQGYQWSQFVKAFPRHTLSRYRKCWYHDPLIHQMTDPYMRIIRKLRLGVSEICSQSWFHNENRSKICTYCSLQQVENLNHFFLVCPAFTEQRSQLNASVDSILNDLNIDFSVASLLGFDHRLKSKNFSKSHASLRRQLYQSTCNFLRSTGRFRFV